MKNENKQDDMISIMEHLLRYVPAVTVDHSVVDPETEETVIISSQRLHPVLFGGDQLTTERVRGCRRTRSNATKTVEKLEGLIPVVEDWHSKVALLKVYACTHHNYINVYVNSYMFCYRLFERGCTILLLELIQAPYTT